jgi:hypothetical protein
MVQAAFALGGIGLIFGVLTAISAGKKEDNVSSTISTGCSACATSASCIKNVDNVQVNNCE